MRSIPTVFFLNGQLHKKLREIPTDNSVIAWSYPEEKRVSYDRNIVRKEFEYAYKMDEVAQLLRRKRGEIRVLVAKGLVHHPIGISYNIGNKNPGQLYFSEEDILQIREDLYARLPRNKYGEIKYSRTPLPSRGQLKAEMHGETSLYMRDEKGDLIKVYKSE